MLQPDLDNVYPPTRFSAAVQTNIAFSSLPEGDLPTAGAHAYSWRIPVLPPTREEQELEGYKPPDPLPEGGDGWLYGFVWFSQEKVTILTVRWVLQIADRPRYSNRMLHFDEGTHNGRWYS